MSSENSIAEKLEQIPRGPGWDAKVIHLIAKHRFGGLKEMFEHYGWSERGSDMMRKVQSRVVAENGSVEEFVAHHKRAENE